MCSILTTRTTCSPEIVQLFFYTTLQLEQLVQHVQLVQIVQLVQLKLVQLVPTCTTFRVHVQSFHLLQLIQPVKFDFTHFLPMVEKIANFAKNSIFGCFNPRSKNLKTHPLLKHLFI